MNGLDVVVDLLDTCMDTICFMFLIRVQLWMVIYTGRIHLSGARTLLCSYLQLIIADHTNSLRRYFNKFAETKVTHLFCNLN